MTLIVLILYFALLLLVSRLARSRQSGSNQFFISDRRSPWYVVAFGMIGASMSGVSFVSVPGWVGTTDMTYLQMCIGFILGYAVVAFVLLPIYYRQNSASIYSYLQHRFGPSSHATGSLFFILSKLTGAAAKLYVAVLLLHRFVFSEWGLSFPVVAAVTIAFIWLYTHQSGIQSLIWTDTLQTAFMLAALGIITWSVCSNLGMSASEAASSVVTDSHFRIFEFDWSSRQNFFKQFLSGAFIVIVMTGLDQDMMQKNLTCRTLRDAQKDMLSYGVMFVPVNLMFLSLGVLLLLYSSQNGIVLPTVGDEILPMLCTSGHIGTLGVTLLCVGVTAASFSSADSALTALTTSVCIDLLPRFSANSQSDTRRRTVHIAFCLVFLLFVCLYWAIGSGSVIDAVYTIASYTYGPLLGMFAFGITTRRRIADRLSLPVCIAAPLLTYAISLMLSSTLGYQMGYEMLILNGAITYAGLFACSRKDN